jgi:hypothetical protein
MIDGSTSTFATNVASIAAELQATHWSISANRSNKGAAKGKPEESGKSRATYSLNLSYSQKSIEDTVKLPDILDSETMTEDVSDLILKTFGSAPVYLMISYDLDDYVLQGSNSFELPAEFWMKIEFRV